jgi:hypothetical protein
MAGENDDLAMKIVGFVGPTLELVTGIVMTATGNAPQGVPIIAKGATNITMQGLRVGGVIQDKPADTTAQITQQYHNVPAEQQIRVNDQLVAKQLPNEGQRLSQEAATIKHIDNSKTLTDEQFRHLYENLPLSERIKIGSYLKAQQLPKQGQRIATDPPPGLKIKKAVPPPPPKVSKREDFPSVDLPVDNSSRLDLPDVSGSSEVSSRQDFPSVDLSNNESGGLDLPDISGSSEVSSREDFPSTDLSAGDNGGGGEDAGIEA